MRTERTHGTRRLSPPGAPVRSRVGKWGSCSPTPTVVSPGSAVVRGRAASSRGPSVVSSVPFAALDHTLMASLTAGDNRERGERVGTSPNARLQSCLGFAVRSAKRDTESVRGLARSLVRRASEHGRMGEREMQPPADSEGTRAEWRCCAFPLRFEFVLVAFMLLSCSWVIAVDQMARQLWCFKFCCRF